VLVLLAAAFAPDGWSNWPSFFGGPARRQLASLADAIGHSRRVEGRLTALPTHVPLRTRPRGEPSAARSAAAAGAVAELDRLARDRRSPENVRMLATARLMVGDTDDAVRLLDRLATEWPADALTQSDLSAAYVARAREPDHAEDWLRALAAAERAAKAAPGRPEPLFNRALCLTSLNLRAEAERAWKAYLTVDRDPPWREEARQHLATLTRPDESDAWDTDRPRIIALAAAGDLAGVAPFVAPHAQALRTLVEDELLPAWGRLTLDTPASAATVLSQARTLATTLFDAFGDRLLVDAVQAIDRTLAEQQLGAIRSLAQGFTTYGEARRLYEENRVSNSETPFREARDLLRRTHDNPMALWCDLQLAIVEYYRGHLPEALKAVEDVGRVAGERGYRSLAARAFWMAGLSETFHPRYTRQIAAYERAFAEFDTLHERANAGAVRSLLAGAYQFLGDRRAVWTHVVEGLRSFQHRMPPRRRHTPLMNAASWSTAWGMPEAALVFADEALAHAARWGAPEAFVEAGSFRARALASLGRGTEAIDALASAREHIGKTADRLIRDRLSAELAQTETEVLAVAAPDRAVTAAADALQYFESRALLLRVPRLRFAEGRAHRRRGDLAAAARSLESAATRFEHERVNVPADDPTRVSHFDAVWNVYRELFEVQLARGASDAELLVIAERGKARSLAERSSDSNSAAWIDRLRQSLAPRTAVVYFVQLADETITWVLTREAMTRHRLAVSTRVVDGNIAEMNEAFEHGGDRATWLPAAARLRDALIAPLGLDRTGIDTLIVVPDGSLNRLPFAALYSSRSRTFLAQDCSLSFAPSAGFLLESSSRALKITSTSTVLAVAVDQASPRDGLPRIPAVLEEARVIAQAFPRTVRLVGTDATLDAMQHALPSADILHFAGHAMPNTAYPQLSRLFLSDGADGVSPVFAQDLDRLKLASVGLVVLASCSGTDGPLSRSEGLVGLSRAFLLQGVPSVLVARWEVDDAATSRFMGRFYGRLARNEALTVAFSAAIRETIESEPSNHQWAAWLLVGAYIGG
jgi:CHAT domain-containing protein